jgi:hypothetical protein
LAVGPGLIVRSTPYKNYDDVHLPPNATGDPGGLLVPNATGCPYSPLPLDSIYLRLRARNRCNHRDFQNIGVNGARSTSMKRGDGSNDSIINSLARSREEDYPLLVFYSLVGNDVCNGHTNQTEPMTPPEEFKERVLDALAYLNGTLPGGSHVVMVGLLDGQMMWNTSSYNRIFIRTRDRPSHHRHTPCTGQMMWNTMHDRVHPALSPIQYGPLCLQRESNSQPPGPARPACSGD